MSNMKKNEKLSFHRFVFLSLAVLAALVLAVQSAKAQHPLDTVDFDLVANPNFTACLGIAGEPAPTAHVTVKRGTFNDTLTIEGDNIRPHLAFDMFTVQRSNLLPNGKVDNKFTNFGMAWYQRDLRAK
jgi:hypothetical protein